MKFPAFAAACVLIAAISPSDAAGSKPCADSVHRQFDFWVGKWSVFAPDRKRVLGHNNVTREFGGCVVQEHWTDAGDGSTGSSFNAYDAGRHVWHQTWVDTNGTVLLLDGGVRSGAMVLSGTRPGRNGGPVIDRITWTPLPGGDVRQHWEASATGGQHWRTVFDGIYVKDRG